MRTQGVKTENGSIKRRAWLAGWFINCQEFKSSRRERSRWDSCSVLVQLVYTDAVSCLSIRGNGEYTLAATSIECAVCYHYNVLLLRTHSVIRYGWIYTVSCVSVTSSGSATSVVFVWRCYHCSSVQFSSVQDGIHALGKARMRPTSSLRNVHNFNCVTVTISSSSASVVGLLVCRCYHCSSVQFSSVQDGIHVLG